MLALMQIETKPDHLLWFNSFKEYVMGTILLVILILALLGVIPTWPHSRNWGYGPSGIVGVILIVLIIMLLTGRL